MASWCRSHHHQTPSLCIKRHTHTHIHTYTRGRNVSDNDCAGTLKTVQPVCLTALCGDAQLLRLEAGGSSSGRLLRHQHACTHKPWPHETPPNLPWYAHDTLPSMTEPSDRGQALCAHSSRMQLGRPSESLDEREREDERGRGKESGEGGRERVEELGASR